MRVDLGLVEKGKPELSVQSSEDVTPEPASEPDEPRKYTHPGRHAHLLGVAGAMRGRGEDEAAILAELRRVNKAECEPPKPDAEVVALAKDVAKRYVPDNYRVSYDDKGRLKLPAKPDHDDRLALCAWLTGVFELDVSHPIVAARRYGGTEGSVVLERVDARNLHFNPYSRLIVPVRFRETLCGQLLDSDGQPPGFKAEHLNKIEHVVRMLAAGFKAEDDRILTDGIVSTFLHEAELVKGEFTTYGNSQDRYHVAVALRPATDWGQRRYLIDLNTGEYVVRVSDLAHAARQHTGATIPKAVLDARMEEYGWTRVEVRGWELPGREGRVEGDHARLHVYRGHPFYDQDVCT